MNNWADIWASRSGPAESLADLIALDGFDTDAGRADVVDWQRYVSEVAEEIGIVAGVGCAGGGGSVIELGCGAGAFLYALGESRKCLELSGVDYSAALIAVAQRFLPQGAFEVADLRMFDFKREYDHVILHSVIHYLSEDEAKSLISNSLNSARKTVSILEVPSKEKEIEAEHKRRQLFGSENYAEKYSALRHTYFKKEFCQSLLRPGWVLQPVATPGIQHTQSQYRFGVVYRAIHLDDSLRGSPATSGN